MLNHNQDVVKRLSNYRKVLYRLKSLGFVKVFSDNLGDALGISSTQVRKDFSSYALTGNKRGGYIIDYLLENLNRILGKNELQKVIIVGCGRMGNAIMNYSGFSEEGIKVMAGFDTAPAVINPDARIPVLDLSELQDFVLNEKVKVALLTVPAAAAVPVFDKLLSANIAGVLNLTPIPLKSSDQCIVHNINIVLELENLFYFIKNGNDE